MSWWKTAKVGDKVVCVDDDEDRYNLPGFFYVGGLDGLTAGSVYTVRCVSSSPDPDLAAGGYVDVWLVEITRQWPHHGFDVRRFRPVQTKSTDTGMAILKSILNGAPVREDA